MFRIFDSSSLICAVTINRRSDEGRICNRSTRTTRSWAWRIFQSPNMASCLHARADLVLEFVPDCKLVNANRRQHFLHRMTQAHELRLARRMARLGTETAFEVLVKAKALEAKGRDVIHLEIGEPDFDTP